MSEFASRIMDAVDIETVVVSCDEGEARRIVLGFLSELGFKDVDVVCLSFNGPGARVRARAYIHRPGDRYGWLGRREAGKSG